MATNGTPDYWIDICERVFAICDDEERFCKQYNLPVPEWVAVRRREYQAFKREWEQKLASRDSAR